MHVAQEIERHEIIDCDFVEARPIAIGMCDDRAGHNLNEKKSHYYDNAFANAPLASDQQPKFRQLRF